MIVKEFEFISCWWKYLFWGFLSKVVFTKCQDCMCVLMEGVYIARDHINRPILIKFDKRALGVCFPDYFCHISNLFIFLWGFTSQSLFKSTTTGRKTPLIFTNIRLFKAKPFQITMIKIPISPKILVQNLCFRKRLK